MLTHGSLFSGIGGFELGARQAGIKTIWNCEILEFNRKVLKKNFPESKQYTDVRLMKNENIDYVDIISGGFPCQDISIANQKNALGLEGERSSLFYEIIAISSKIRPRYIVLENSPMLLVRGFNRVLSEFSRIGYNAQWQCIQASDFELPHKRKRLFIIAYSITQRSNDFMHIFKSIPKILQKQSPGQASLPMPIKRINRSTDFEKLRMDNEFSRELDKRSLEGFGNAVIPGIAKYLFECIKEFDSKLKGKE